MNIIDAIKSGKRFRVKGDRDWLSAGHLENIGPKLILTYRDILSADWEVDGVKIKLGAQEVADAWHKAALSNHGAVLLTELLVNLGLE